MDVLATSAGHAGFPGWQLHPDVWLVTGVVGVGYWLLTRSSSLARRQRVAAGAGLFTVAVASTWPIHDLAEGYLYSVHMVQHLLYSLIAAPLLLLGVPAAGLRRLFWLPRLGPALRWMVRPVPALVQFNAIVVLSHWPVWVDTTLRHHSLHLLAHIVVLASALIMWVPVVSTLAELRIPSDPGRMLYLFLQSIVPTVPASFLTFGETPLYHFYEEVPRLWGWSVLGDQQVAGLIMKVGAGVYLWVVIAVIFFRWYNREEADGLLTWDQVEAELRALDGPPAR